MNTYEFTLKFSVPGLGVQELEDRLFSAGCDDALLGVGAAGRIALDFSREANSALEATASAIRDVKSAIPEARLIEATPDIVGLTDIASILDVTRQHARKLVLEADCYPVPFHAGNPLLWHLSDILQWFGDTNKYRASAVLIEVAGVNKTINAARNNIGIDPRTLEEINAIVANQP